jgi:hypothetical protein
VVSFLQGLLLLLLLVLLCHPGCMVAAACARSLSSAHMSSSSNAVSCALLADQFLRC